MSKTDNIVYSTGPEQERGARKVQSEPVYISFRKSGKGSGMTLIEKLPMHPEGKENLLREFKKKIGAGGTLKFGVIELQGDRRDFVEQELVKAGYRVKRKG